MSMAEVLVEARAKIAQGWCQGASARDGYGNNVDPDAPTATCWCLFGAIISTNKVLYTNVYKVYDQMSAVEGCEVGPQWNDVTGRTQAEVVAMLDRTIAVVEAQSL